MTGIELKTWQRSLGISNIELARLTGKTVECVSRWRSSDEVPPYVETIILLYDESKLSDIVHPINNSPASHAAVIS